MYLIGTIIAITENISNNTQLCIYGKTSFLHQRAYFIFFYKKSWFLAVIV